jgi:hypothetical protein
MPYEYKIILSKRIWSSNFPWFWVKFYKHFAKVKCLDGNIEIEILKSAANCYPSREWRHFPFFQSSLWLIKLSKQNRTKKMKKNWEMLKIHQNWGTLFHILTSKNLRQKLNFTTTLLWKLSIQKVILLYDNDSVSSNQEVHTLYILKERKITIKNISTRKS